MSEEVKSPWPGPAGMIPVTSGKAEDANVINRNYLDRILVEMRVMDAVEPSLTTTIFGKEYPSPIMFPAFSHLNKVVKDGRLPMQEKAAAAKALGIINWVGMEPNDEFKDIAAVGADTVRIIKPFADHNTIMDEIRVAEEAGAVAVGIDIDHVPGTNGKYDVVDGIPLGPVFTEDLKKYVATSKLPFVAKGVLSVHDALRAKEAGCAAVVLSHHHGRIPFGVPPTLVLPQIKEVLKDSGVAIFLDGSIESGYDAYKALALGADAVLTGRTILKPLLKEGTDGVVQRARKLDEQLSELMMYTCIKDTKSFDASVLHY